MTYANTATTGDDRSGTEARPRVTINDIKAMKQSAEKIAMLTVYDYPAARLLDAAGIPMLLVGDSLAQVVLGYPDTLHVTMAEMLSHTAAVARGANHALIVGDMPFMSYQNGRREALRNAARFLREGNAQAVKLEGGGRMADVVAYITSAGIPVMGHLGVTPQSFNQLGGFKVRGKDVAVAQQMVDDARALETAGAFAVVLETVPTPLAAYISQQLTIPTIGIGAGAGCDGQVQVLHDVLGLAFGHHPRHAKQFTDLAAQISTAAHDYMAQVQAGDFPTQANSFKMDEQLLEQLDRF